MVKLIEKDLRNSGKCHVICLNDKNEEVVRNLGCILQISQRFCNDLYDTNIDPEENAQYDTKYRVKRNAGDYATRLMHPLNQINNNKTTFKDSVHVEVID